MNVELIIAGIAAIAGIAVFLYCQDNGIQTTTYTYFSKKLPVAMNGFKIVHLSDLHNKRFGKNQRRLQKTIGSLSPDVILITGDIIDCHRTDLKAAMELIRAAVQIAPVYYAPGNHECKSNQYGRLSPMLAEAGVHVLNNRAVKTQCKGADFTLAGVKDIEFLKETKKSKPTKEFGALLADVLNNKTGFTMLLAHRPEYFDLYASQGADLVFSGHAHGGQIRLPLIGGLFAPGQGWNPKYTAGLYYIHSSAMFVSRGLGNSEFPFRMFNRPEVVAVTLKTGNR